MFSSGWWRRRSLRSGTVARCRPPPASPCSLVSHCTSSPAPAAPRPPQMRLFTAPSLAFPQARFLHPLPGCLPAHVHAVFLGQVFAGQCRPESAIHIHGKDRHRFLARLGIRLPIRRAFPRSPWITAPTPRFFNSFSSRLTCRTLSPSSSAASRCVISRFLAFFSTTSR